MSISISKDEVLERVKEAIEQGKGTCYCCMHLNTEWENVPPEYDFAANSFQFKLPSAGINSFLNNEFYMPFYGAEGINMMSMVFCRRGGIISAKESGQKNLTGIVTGVSDDLIKLLKSYETGADVKGNFLPDGEPALKTYQGADDDEQEIKYQFGEYSDHGKKGTMRRRADELDIIFYGDYERDEDKPRYGDIWGKKTNPNSVTKGYE